MPVVINTAHKPAPPDETGQASGHKRLGATLEGAILVVAIAIGLVVGRGAYESTIVTTRSMSPTILPGDYMLVDHRRSLHGSWRRGDIILFQSPPSWDDSKEDLVKRVIGLPGENLEIRDGQVLIGGRPLKEDYLAETPRPQHRDPMVLGRDEYYVMGDNRNNSDDSRYRGPVPDRYITGRIVFRIGPLSRFGRLAGGNYD